jgi:tripartite-type tricarboxylate transporter receptor subunit TctC
VLPEVTTMAEAGIADFVMDGGWYGLFAPARTATDIIEPLDQEVTTALKIPSVREHHAALGLDPVGSSPAHFRIPVRPGQKIRRARQDRQHRAQ